MYVCVCLCVFRLSNIRHYDSHSWAGQVCRGNRTIFKRVAVLRLSLSLGFFPVWRGYKDIPPAATMDETRALLDQLMGRERDVPVAKRTNRKRRVWDDDICKPYLCGKARNQSHLSAMLCAPRVLCVKCGHAACFLLLVCVSGLRLYTRVFSLFVLLCTVCCR